MFLNLPIPFHACFPLCLVDDGREIAIAHHGRARAAQGVATSIGTTWRYTRQGIVHGISGRL